MEVEPGCGVLVCTGVALEMPRGTYGRLTPRSSQIVRGVEIGPGVIDRDFRGEVKVMVAIRAARHQKWSFCRARWKRS